MRGSASLSSCLIFTCATASDCGSDDSALWQKLAHGQNDTGQYKLVSKEGEVRWFQGYYSPIPNANGAVVKVTSYMTDITRAKLDAAGEGQNLPIVFDLTTNGLGQSRNLLTLAFEPPFLAATLCLLVALLLVGWRAFRRFGPPLAEEQALSFGKAQLVENGGGLIQRTGRMHLLTRPYAALVESRLARKLGVRSGSRSVLDAALVRRGLDPVSPRLETLESARNTRDILRAARALHSLERTIAR